MARSLLLLFLFSVVPTLSFASENSERDALVQKRLESGRSFYQGGKNEEAIREFREAIKLDPNHSWAHLWLGRALGRKIEKMNPVRAAFGVGDVRREFERAVELDPRNLEARSDLLQFYMDAPGVFGGGMDKARKQAEAIAKLDAAEGHSAYAKIAEKEQRFEQAEQEYRAAIDANPKHPGYRRDLEAFWKKHGMQRREAEKLQPQ